MSKYSRILLAELVEPGVGTPVEILRVGKFIDSRGREVEVTSEDLDAYVRNFEAQSAGQDVPIDIEHRRGEAAGWLRALQRAGDVLLGVVEWNPLGEQLVGDKIYRYVSATLDLAEKVLRAVSLVNFPAVKGLRPVELSEGVYTFQMADSLLERIVSAVRAVFEPEGEGGDLEEQDESSDQSDQSDQMDDEGSSDTGTEVETMDPKELAELRAEIRQELEAEMVQQAQTEAELREQVRGELEAELREEFEARQARRRELVEFAADVCGDEGVALAANPEDVVEFLESLDDEDLERAKSLLKTKVVEFGERGSGRGGRSDLKQLPDAYAAGLDAGKLTIADLNHRVIQADLGDLSEYDLSKWKEE